MFQVFEELWVRCGGFQVPDEGQHRSRIVARRQEEFAHLTKTDKAIGLALSALPRLFDAGFFFWLKVPVIVLFARPNAACARQISILVELK